MTMTARHRRSDDPDDFLVEHRRSDTGLAALASLLGMPIGTIFAIGTLVVSLFGVWLIHDRAIASAQQQGEATKERVMQLETREEDRRKQDAIVNAALARIETKLDDVKDRVGRVENNQPLPHGGSR